MSTILYEWEFANYLCRVVESEPGIVHFEQARKESDGDPRVMEFQLTATPMGAANEIIQLHQALAEAKMLNRDLAAFYQGYQEDRNRRERELADAMEERDRLLREVVALNHDKQDLSSHLDCLRADLEAAREAIRDCTSPRENGNYECRFGVVPDRILPAVRAAWEGQP